MDNLKSFFANLSTRFGSENDMSDITWTMCHASPSFMEQWVRFFFDVKTEDIETINREVLDSNGKGCRVDFLITVRDDPKPYIIEVKKWDQKHHFVDYDEAYEIGPKRFGYITNYFLEREGYVVKQWRQFYNTLSSALKNGDYPEEEAGLIAGYCEYIKNVCGITMIEEKIDLTKMTSLYDLTVVSREVAEFSTDAFDVNNYSTSHRDDLRWLFLEATYKYPQGWGRQYPFIEIIYRHPEPYICAGFDCRKGWAKDIVDFIYNNRGLISKVEKEYCKYSQCTAPEPKKDYYFFLSEDALEEFKETQTLERQKEILRAFFEEVLMFPVHLREELEKK